jgi:cell division protein FtsB
MTEIEQAFYDTLKRLEADYSRGLEALRQESQQREIAFSKAVDGLSGQVSSLSKHNEQLSAQVSSLSTQISTLARLLKT